MYTILYTKVFIKLFNKLTPLEDGELKEKTYQVAKDLGYEIKNISIFKIPLSKLSRAAEFKADSVAAKSGYNDSMITALKILTKENFSNLASHPIVVALTYSHPPTSQRIDALEHQNPQKPSKTNQASH